MTNLRELGDSAILLVERPKDVGRSAGPLDNCWEGRPTE